MRVILLGSDGMLGSDLGAALKDCGHAVESYTQETLDITNEDDLQKIYASDADVVVNCAAYTNVDGAEEDETTCLEVNTHAVKRIAEICNSTGKSLVQFSTDYVFDGVHGYYREDSKADPLNVYGRSKADSEGFIRDTLSEHFIVRTAWLYGPNGKNFVETIIDKCGKEPQLLVVNDQIGCPTYTVDLADGVVRLIEEGLYGTFHLTNDGECSWYDFAEAIVAESDGDCMVNACDSTEFVQKATRPKQSVLVNTKCPKFRHWQLALKDYINKRKI